MRFSALSILLLFVAASRGADDVPKRFNFDRYQGMMERSPFAVATAVAVPAATPDFAKDLYVANAAKSPEGDMVTIASSSDKNFKKYLTTKEAVDGFTVANIEWSEKVGATKVTISKDGKYATLTFNQALIAEKPTPNVPAPATPMVPPSGGATPVQTVFPKPAPVPSVPTPRVRGVIPRNPAAAQEAATPAAKPEHPES